MGTRITLQNVRLSYPHLFQPRAIQPGDEPKYGAAFLIPKTVQTPQGPQINPVITQIQQAIEAEKANMWGANVPPAAKTTLYDGDTDPKYANDEASNGHMILNSSANASAQPILVDQNLQAVINPATFYPGCYVNADIGVYAYDKGISKGIAAGLNGVQFAADGERLDNRPTAEQMFGAVAGAPAAIAPGVANIGAQPAPAAVAPQSAGVAPTQSAQPVPAKPAFLG